MIQEFNFFIPYETTNTHLNQTDDKIKSDVFVCVSVCLHIYTAGIRSKHNTQYIYHYHDMRLY